MPQALSLSGRRVRAMFVLAVAALTVLAALTPAQSAPTKPSASHAGRHRAAKAKVRFTPPVPLPGGGAEPSIRNDNSGKFAAYVSAPTGLGSNFWRIKEIRNPDGSISLDPGLPLQPDLGTGGGDSEISLGRKPGKNGCQNIAYSGLHNIDLLNNFTAAMSANCGKTFTDPNLYATQNTLTDRQWQTFDGSLTNFLIYHKVDTSQIVVARSLDGGATYTSLSPDGSRGIIDAETMPNVVNDNQIGNIVTDYSQPIKGLKYANGEQAHALYAIFAGPRDPADNAEGQQGSEDPSAYNHIDTIYVGKSLDGGETWTDTRVYTTNPKGRERELNLLFPVIAVDRAGTLYTVWSDQFKVQYAFSRNHGKTWSKPFQVNPDNRRKKPDKAKADIFPWIAAGGKGKLDVVWYHGQGGAPRSNLNHRDPGDAKTKWTVGFAELFRANRWNAKHHPRPRIVSRSQNVSGLIHKGDICNNGIGCDAFGGDRTLLDFFEVSIDHKGRANIAYASDAGAPGSATSTYIRQNGGRSALTGKRIPTQRVVPLHINNGTSCPGPQVVDAYGDARSNVLVGPSEQGGNLDTYDIGAVQFATPDATHVKVTMTIKDLSAVPVSGTTATMYIVFWQFGGKTYYVNATTNGPGAQFYDTGIYTDNFMSTGDPQGEFNEGKNGTIVWTVERADVGNPPNGSELVHPHAETHGSFTAAGSGLRYVAFVDRGPNVRTGAPYTLGGSC